MKRYQDRAADIMKGKERSDTERMSELELCRALAFQTQFYPKLAAQKTLSFDWLFIRVVKQWWEVMSEVVWFGWVSCEELARHAGSLMSVSISVFQVSTFHYGWPTEHDFSWIADIWEGLISSWILGTTWWTKLLFSKVSTMMWQTPDDKKSRKPTYHLIIDNH